MSQCKNLDEVLYSADASKYLAILQEKGSFTGIDIETIVHNRALFESAVRRLLSMANNFGKEMIQRQAAQVRSLARSEVMRAPDARMVIREALNLRGMIVDRMEQLSEGRNKMPNLKRCTVLDIAIGALNAYCPEENFFFPYLDTKSINFHGIIKSPINSKNNGILFHHLWLEEKDLSRPGFLPVCMKIT